MSLHKQIRKDALLAPEHASDRPLRGNRGTEEREVRFGSPLDQQMVDWLFSRRVKAFDRGGTGGLSLLVMIAERLDRVSFGRDPRGMLLPHECPDLVGRSGL